MAENFSFPIFSRDFLDRGALAPWKSENPLTDLVKSVALAILTAGLFHVTLLAYNLYRFRWPIKPLTADAQDQIKTKEVALQAGILPPVNWDKLIEYSSAHAPEIAEIKELLKNSGVNECPYKKILFCGSSSSSTMPLFDNDGAYSNYENAEGYKGEEILVVVAARDKERNYELKTSPHKTVSYVKSEAKREGWTDKKALPPDMHIKILTYEDWHSIFIQKIFSIIFQRPPLSQKACESFTSTKHNLA